MRTAAIPAVAACAVLLVTGSAFAQGPKPTTRERVAALKANLAASKANLRKYEWVETTVVKVKGEEKSRQQQRCYYGADGALQKLPISATPKPAKKGGLRGKVVAKKTAEMTDYMKKSVGLIKMYMPPDPARLQKAIDAGRVSIEMLEPGKRLRLNFRDYLVPGDNLGIEVAVASNIPLGATIATYLDKPGDTVTLVAILGQLNDGTVYPAKISLDAKAKGVNVAVTNTGYLKR